MRIRWKAAAPTTAARPRCATHGRRLTSQSTPSNAQVAAWRDAVVRARTVMREISPEEAGREA